MFSHILFLYYISFILSFSVIILFFLSLLLLFLQVNYFFAILSFQKSFHYSYFTIKLFLIIFPSLLFPYLYICILFLSPFYSRFIRILQSPWSIYSYLQMLVQYPVAPTVRNCVPPLLPIFVSLSQFSQTTSNSKLPHYYHNPLGLSPEQWGVVTLPGPLWFHILPRPRKCHNRSDPLPMCHCSGIRSINLIIHPVFTDHPVLRITFSFTLPIIPPTRNRWDLTYDVLFHPSNDASSFLAILWTYRASRRLTMWWSVNTFSQILKCLITFLFLSVHCL